MTIRDGYDSLRHLLTARYGVREAGLIAGMAVEKLTGLDRSGILVHGAGQMAAATAEDYKRFSEELQAGRPVQYVLGEAWFCGMPLFVNESVLIPRPETEELVDWVAQEYSGRSPIIADLGTGSGCIALGLKKKLPRARVTGVDVSQEALQTAKKNAALTHLDVDWIAADMLSGRGLETIVQADVLVSNPPYITRAESGSMEEHVTKFEPHLALFVDNPDPLLFYKAIARLATEKLRPGGEVFVETHAERAEEVKTIFTQIGYAESRQDLQGKPRMVRAILR